MIYATQDVVGFTDDIVEAHRILSEDQPLLVQINSQLRALQIAEIEAQVSDNVRGRR